MKPSCEIDHILIACPSLDSANVWFEKKTGVKPQPGGSHPDRGTCNTLVSLTDKTYLELLAPDPRQRARSVGRDECERLKAPAFGWWALRTHDLQGARDVLVSQGITCSEIQQGIRQTLDGSTLCWELLMTRDADLGCQLPFFIRWKNKEQHPGVQPAAGSISGLAFSGPGAARLEDLLDRVGLQAGRVCCTPGASSQQRLDLIVSGKEHTIPGPPSPLTSLC